jgi:hypothetical protein
MPRGKTHTAEQIVSLLRQIEVGTAKWEDDAASLQGSRDPPGRLTIVGARSMAVCKWIRRAGWRNWSRRTPS